MHHAIFSDFTLHLSDMPSTLLKALLLVCLLMSLCVSSKVVCCTRSLFMNSRQYLNKVLLYSCRQAHFRMKGRKEREREKRGLLRFHSKHVCSFSCFLFTSGVYRVCVLFPYKSPHVYTCMCACICTQELRRQKLLTDF